MTATMLDIRWKRGPLPAKESLAQVVARERAHTDEVARLKAVVFDLQQRLFALHNPTFDPTIYGETAKYTPNEREMLCLLFSQINKTVRHASFMEVLYSNEDPAYLPDPGLFKTRICTLRRKLQRHKIVTDFGIGYRLVPL